jgi:hypothetical protein
MNNPLPEQTAVDERIKLYKALLGVLPGGSFVVEYLIDHVRDQRAERLLAYIERLNHRLERLESLEFTQTYEYAALVENSIVEAIKPVSQNRLGWIASIVVPSVAPTEREIEFRRSALQILTDLSDNDVQFLLAQANLSSAFKLEKSMSGLHSISMADAKSLPAHELFLKRLENAQLELHRGALVAKRLLVHSEERSPLKYRLSELGRLFLFVLGGEHSVR